MPTILLYTKPNCSLCDTTRYHLRDLLAALPPVGWIVEERNILDDQAWFAAYHETIPVIAVEGGPTLTAPAAMDRVQLYRALVATMPTGAASNVPISAAGSTPNYSAAAAGMIGVIDRAGNGLGRHWLAAANTLLGLFVALPWLAPICARLGWWALADPIYTAYMLFCHQLPERAAFIFGYQVAYCWRNSAIYTTIFIGALIYAQARQAGADGRLGWLLRPMAWPVFALLLVPLGLDGFSHLLGLRETNAWFNTLTGGQFSAFSLGDAVGTLNWWLRIISGTLFGYAVVRLLYPWIGIVLDQGRILAAAPPLPARAT